MDRKGDLPAADDDFDPSEPTGPEVVYAERTCPVCGGPVNDKQTYDKDASRKKAERSRQIKGATLRRRAG